MRGAPAELDGQREKVDWDDPNRYEWVISGRGARRRTGFWKFLYFAGPMVGPGLIIPALAFFWTAVFFWIIPDAYKFRTGMTITVLLMGLALYFLLRVRWGPTKKKAKAKSDLGELLTTSTGIIACVMSKAIAGVAGAMAPFLPPRGPARGDSGYSGHIRFSPNEYRSE